MGTKTAINPLLGTFELALFMRSGPLRFPDSMQLAVWSFAIPFLLMLVWTYPLAAVPTEILGPRSYGEIVLIHASSLGLHLAVFLPLLWLLVKHLGKTDKFWRLIAMNNFCFLAGFLITAPLLGMVVAGHHTWDEIYNALLLIMFYEIALTAYVLTRGLEVPWQFGTGLAFFDMFIAQGVSNTIFAFYGVS